jgi:hypothetical protein
MRVNVSNPPFARYINMLTSNAGPRDPKSHRKNQSSRCYGSSERDEEFHVVIAKQSKANVEGLDSRTHSIPGDLRIPARVYPKLILVAPLVKLG